VSSMSEDRYTVDYRIVSTAKNEVTTDGDTVVVTFDYRAQRKIAIPAEMKKKIEQLEGRAFQ